MGRLTRRLGRGGSCLWCTATLSCGTRGRKVRAVGALGWRDAACPAFWNGCHSSRCPSASSNPPPISISTPTHPPTPRRHRACRGGAGRPAGRPPIHPPGEGRGPQQGHAVRELQGADGGGVRGAGGGGCRGAAGEEAAGRGVRGCGWVAAWCWAVLLFFDAWCNSSGRYSGSNDVFRLRQRERGRTRCKKGETKGVVINANQKQVARPKHGCGAEQRITRVGWSSPVCSVAV